MKVGLVLDDTLDTPDGVQQYVLHVGEWLAAQGHDVHYLVGHTERKDIPNIHSLSRNLRVRFNGNRMSIPLPTSRRRLRKFLNEQQFDVLHIQVPYSPFMAGKLLLSAPPQTAVVGMFHILPYSGLVTLANRVLALMNYRSGKRFDQMLATSPPAAVFAREVYGYQAAVSPNPVDVGRFGRVKHHAARNAPATVVFLGRLVERKGVMQLLQAVQYLLENKLYEGKLQVVIGGKGELLPALQRFVRDHCLHDVVSFAGFVDEATKPEFVAQADIAVYPSLGGESFGIVLVEGMAAARGVVLAGNNPGYASVMQPFTGQLFDPRDTPAFAGKLARYLASPAERLQAAAAQRDYVRRFDINVVGGQLLEVYAQALQSRGRS